jgi:DNA-binding transcriptional MerR regulator
MSDFENREVTRIVGIKPRTLIDWSERGLVVPHVQDAAGVGSRRRYSEDNLIELAIIKTLLADGIKRDLVRGIMQIVRDLSLGGRAANPLSFSTRAEEDNDLYLVINLHAPGFTLIVIREGQNTEEKQKDLAGLGQRVLEAGRCYVLNLGYLKKQIRRKLNA